MDPIAAIQPSATLAMLTICMMGICTICMATTSMSIRLKCQRPIPTGAHPNIVREHMIRAMSMDLGAAMKLCPMGITWTTWSRGIFITLMAIIATITAN